MASFPFTLKAFSGFESNDEYEALQTLNFGTVVTTTSSFKRGRGQFGLQLLAGAGEAGYVTVRPPDLPSPGLDGDTGSSDAYASFFWRAGAPSDSAPFASFVTSGVNRLATLFQSGANKLQIAGEDNTIVETGSTTLVPGTWYRIDFFRGSGSPSYVVQLDGVVELSGDAATSTSVVASIAIGKLFSPTSSALTCYYDDVVLTTGDWFNADDYSVVCRVPNADVVTAGWTHVPPPPPNVDLYTHVDERPQNGDTRYIIPGANDSTYRAAGTTIDYAVDTVFGIKVNIVAAKTGVGAAVAVVASSDGTEAVSPLVGLPGSGLYTGKAIIYPDDFGSSNADWTLDAANALTFGCQNGVSEPKVTQILAHVLHGKVNPPLIPVPFNFGG